MVVIVKRSFLCYYKTILKLSLIFYFSFLFPLVNERGVFATIVKKGMI